MILPTTKHVESTGDTHVIQYWFTSDATQILSVVANDKRVAEALGMQTVITTLGCSDVLATRLQAKFLEIDYGTDVLIESGFEYPPASGIRHSLTMEAQSRLNALFTLYNSHVLMQMAMALKVIPPQSTPLQDSLPLSYNSLNDTHVVQLVEPDDVKAFCMRAFGTMSAILNSGTQVKQALRQCVDDEESVINFVDSRFV